VGFTYIYERDESLIPKNGSKLLNLKELKKSKKQKKVLDFSGKCTYYINASSEDSHRWNLSISNAE
jgi:hypothetical protein